MAPTKSPRASIRAETVFAERIVGKPYLEIEIDREAIARHGLTVEAVQRVIQLGLGGATLTTSVEGRRRLAVRVRYMREERDSVEALRKERTTLESAGVWDLAAVREWRDVRASPGEHMCGRIFAIMGEKHAERKSAPADRVYKARIVFAGNNIQTASGTAPHELYTEISQTPAAMNTVRAALAIAALRGFVPKVRDATQAYIQAVIDKAGRPRTWVRLPKAWWPAHWFDGQGVPLYYDPVVVLVRALYGHPESGALWDRHLRAILVKLQWRRVESHPGLYVHSVTMAILVVYVDDLLLAAPPAEEARLWAEIEAHVGFGGDPEAISKFLGGHHKVLIDRGGVTSASCQMAEFISDAVQCYMDEIGVQRLPAVRSPYLDEDFVPKGQDEPGVMAKTASSHLMKVLFAARLRMPSRPARGDHEAGFQGQLLAAMS